MATKTIHWEAFFTTDKKWHEVSAEGLLFTLIGSGLISAYREVR